jgi:hypothetical protein
MVEIGSRADIYGCLLSVATDASGNLITYPIADYKVDGVSGESPQVSLLDKTLT